MYNQTTPQSIGTYPYIFFLFNDDYSFQAEDNSINAFLKGNKIGLIKIRLSSDRYFELLKNYYL